MSINYNEDAGETAGTMELDIEFSKSYNELQELIMISTIKKRVDCVYIVTVVE